MYHYQYKGTLIVLIAIFCRAADGRASSQVRQKAGTKDEVEVKIVRKEDQIVKISEESVNSKSESLIKEPLQPKLPIDKLIIGGGETSKSKVIIHKEKSKTSQGSNAQSKTKVETIRSEAEAVKSQSKDNVDAVSLLTSETKSGTSIKSGISENLHSVKHSENIVKSSSENILTKTSSSKSSDEVRLEGELIGGDRGLSVGREIKTNVAKGDSEIVIKGGSSGTTDEGLSSGIKSDNVEHTVDIHIDSGSVKVGHASESKDTSIIKMSKESSISVNDKIVTTIVDTSDVGGTKQTENLEAVISGGTSGRHETVVRGDISGKDISGISNVEITKGTKSSAITSKVEHADESSSVFTRRKDDIIAVKSDSSDTDSFGGVIKSADDSAIIKTSDSHESLKKGSEVVISEIKKEDSIVANVKESTHASSSIAVSSETSDLGETVDSKAIKTVFVSEDDSSLIEETDSSIRDRKQDVLSKKGSTNKKINNKKNKKVVSSASKKKNQDSSRRDDNYGDTECNQNCDAAGRDSYDYQDYSDGSSGVERKSGISSTRRISSSGSEIYSTGDNINLGTGISSHPTASDKVLINEESWNEGDTVVTTRKYKGKGPMGQTIYYTETSRKTSRPVEIFRSQDGTGGTFRSSSESRSFSSSSSGGQGFKDGINVDLSSRPRRPIPSSQGGNQGINIALDKMRSGSESEWEGADYSEGNFGGNQGGSPSTRGASRTSSARKKVVNLSLSSSSSGSRFGGNERGSESHSVESETGSIASRRGSASGNFGVGTRSNEGLGREDASFEITPDDSIDASIQGTRSHPKKNPPPPVSQIRSRPSRSILHNYNTLARRQLLRRHNEGEIDDDRLVVNIYIDTPRSHHSPAHSPVGISRNNSEHRANNYNSSANPGAPAVSAGPSVANNPDPHTHNGEPLKIHTRNRLLPRKCGKIMIGKSDEVDSPKIVRGTEVRAGTWPWLVTFQHDGYHSCGGTIISDTHVITATHCFPSFVQIENFTVHAGKHIKEGVVLPIEQKRIIKRLVKHPGFNKAGKFDNDISLVEVNSPFVFGEYVQPACLPTNTERINSRSKCCVAGFGDTKGTGNDDVMNELCVPLLSTSLCNSTEFYNGRLTSTMLCAGFEEGQKDSCKGDSGGPFICTMGGIHKLFGITSWGEGCANAKRPGLYTDLSIFLDWIKENL